MKLRVALAQINPTVGDLAGNAGLIADSVKGAQAHGANLIVFPEMIVTGYPVEDLALRPSFQAASIRAIEEIAAAITGDIVADNDCVAIKDQIILAASHVDVGNGCANFLGPLLY